MSTNEDYGISDSPKSLGLSPKQRLAIVTLSDKLSDAALAIRISVSLSKAFNDPPDYALVRPVVAAATETLAELKRLLADA